METSYLFREMFGVALRRKRQRPCGLWRSPGVLIAHRIMHRPVQPLVLVPGFPGSCILRLG
jgi:hypothetical protein